MGNTDWFRDDDLEFPHYFVSTHPHGVAWLTLMVLELFLIFAKLMFFGSLDPNSV